MQENKKKISKKTKILRFIWLFHLVNSVIFTSLPVDMLIKSGFKDNSKITYLKDNWDVVINGKEHKDVVLDEFSFDTLTIGDEVEMKTVLPEEWKYEDAVMCFHTRQSTVDMYVEDELVYQYGHERREGNETVGSGLLFISMFDEYKGKDLRIVLNVSERQAFSSLDEVWISEWHDSYRYIITQNRFPMFIGFFLFIFGIVIGLVGLSTFKFALKNWDVFFIAAFSMCMGLWTLCYHNCILIFSLPLYSISLMEYMTLLVSPVPLIAYLRKYVYVLENKNYKKIYNVLLTVQVIFTLFLIIFHATDTIHAAATLPFFHVMLAINILFFSRVIYLALSKDNNSKKVKIFVIIIMVIVGNFMGYDLVVYIANRYLGVELPGIPALSTIGIIIFVVLLVVDFVKSVNSNILEEQEKELLVEKAYMDDLTHINNRLFCSEYMNKIADEVKEYSIITFDVNGLKETNDVFGHSKGDMLIVKAANAISEIFSKEGIVGRMGGDEFISIIKSVDKDKLNKLADEFYMFVDKMNKDTDDKIELSIAMGYASSTDIDNYRNVERVYQLADNQMYDVKRKMKM